MAQDVIRPAKINNEDVMGGIYNRPGGVVTETDGVTEHDVSTMTASDKKFETGMFKAGPGRYEYNEPYGVDEFMFFLEGSVTLTSSDGSVQVIGLGEGVTIPREWIGIWEDTGYSKIYVIYK